MLSKIQALPLHPGAVNCSFMSLISGPYCEFVIPQFYADDNLKFGTALALCNNSSVHSCEFDSNRMTRQQLVMMQEPGRAGILSMISTHVVDTLERDNESYYSAA